MATQDEMLRTASDVQLGNYAPAPFVLVEGRGCRARDAAGRDYLDLSGGLAVLSVGHCHPTLVKAIAAQASQLMHVSNIFYNQRAIELATALCARTPFDKVYFCNSGSEANESMLKLARRFHHDRGDTERVEFVAAHKSFHGRTFGSLSITGQLKYQQGMAPMLPGVHFVDYNDVDALAAAVGPTTAGVILEPIQAEGGIIEADASYLQAARRICDQHGALLLLDEVQTGTGRTGRFLAQEWSDVIPDACSLAKGIGGGFPLGAMLVRQSVAGGLPPGSHASTFGGNPLACAAGLAVLQVLDEEALLPHVEKLGASLRERLSAFQQGLDSVVQVRGRGLLQGAVLAADVDPGATLARIHAQGVLATLAGGNVLRISPALTITQDELDEGLDVIEDVLSDPVRKAP